jgi:zona occludens toxin (predicted ATPase)
MPIHLYTGQPGNGKTALMVEHLIQEASKAERPIVAAGIDGLAEGLALELKDPRQWNAIDPDAEAVCNCSASDRPHGHVIPDGSLIFVDEAWKWFGHLQDATRQKTPDHVLQLAEHRHRGIDFVWTTQMPNQIFPFVRGLGGAHTHVLRRFGTHMIDTYRWEEWVDDVKSITRRENSQKVTRRLPSQVFEKYKSATLHTIKRRILLKVMVLPLALLVAVGCGWYAYSYFKPDAIEKRLTGKMGAPALAGAPSSEGGERKAPAV